MCNSSKISTDQLMLLDNHTKNEIGFLRTLLPSQQDLGSPRRVRGQQGQCRVKDQCKSHQGCIKQREGDNMVLGGLAINRTDTVLSL